MVEPRRRNCLSPRPESVVGHMQPRLMQTQQPRPLLTTQTSTHPLWRRQPGRRRLHPVTMFSDPSSALYWPPDVARYNMEALLFLSSGWLRTACVVAALFW